MAAFARGGATGAGSRKTLALRARSTVASPWQEPAGSLSSPAQPPRLPCSSPWALRSLADHNA
ncbi:MAG: hypothetical protein HYZ73_08330 [Elusimicrobia bacterium]|nr:hypothetical protein [Elusimicrobiota bacterium]